MEGNADFLSTQPGPPQVELLAPQWAIYVNVDIVDLTERLSKADALVPGPSPLLHIEHRVELPERGWFDTMAASTRVR